MAITEDDKRDREIIRLRAEAAWLKARLDLVEKREKELIEENRRLIIRKSRDVDRQGGIEEDFDEAADPEDPHS